MNPNIHKYQAASFTSAFQRLGLDPDKFKAAWNGGNGGTGEGNLYEATLLFRANVGGKQVPAGKTNVSASTWRALAQSGYVREVHREEVIAAYDRDLELVAKQTESEGAAEGEGDDKGGKGGGKKSGKR